MITEEKLQNFIDNLRAGKFDIEGYYINIHPTFNDISICIPEKKFNLTLKIRPSYTIHEKHTKFLFPTHYIDKVSPAIVIIQFESVTYEVKINDFLYDSFISYITEYRYKKHFKDEMSFEQLLCL